MTHNDAGRCVDNPVERVPKPHRIHVESWEQPAARCGGDDLDRHFAALDEAEFQTKRPTIVDAFVDELKVE